MPLEVNPTSFPVKELRLNVPPLLRKLTPVLLWLKGLRDTFVSDGHEGFETPISQRSVTNCELLMS